MRAMHPTAPKPQLDLLVLGDHRELLLAAIGKIVRPAALIDHNGKPLQPTMVHRLFYDTAMRSYHIQASAGLGCFDETIIENSHFQAGAIVVVDASSGCSDKVRHHLRLARLGALSGPIVVFMDDVQKVDEPAFLDLVEAELRALLLDHGFGGASASIIRGSARLAWEDGDSARGHDAIQRLIAAVDEFVLLPERPIERPFLMAVEDVFSLSDRGTVCVGRIERGVIAVGTEIEVIGTRPTRKTTVIGLERYRISQAVAAAGEHIAVVVQDLKRNDIDVGDVLCMPASVERHTKFKASAYMFTREEMLRSRPFFTRCELQFRFQTGVASPGVLLLQEGVEMAMPGESISIDVFLGGPTILEDNMRFVIRDRYFPVGVGVVTSIIE